MNYFSIALSGHSIVSALVLLFAYLFFLKSMRKTPNGMIASVVMLLGLAVLQTAHLLFFVKDFNLLASRGYCFLLSLLPVAFLFFSREVLFLNDRFRWFDIALFLPIPASLLLPITWVPVMAFTAGSLYTFFIALKVVKLRNHTGRFRFELFFFGLFFLMALTALMLGLILPFLDNTVFYHAYANTISVAMILVVSALLIFPELLSDILIITETAYANSHLENIDVEKKIGELDRLMIEDKCYEDEELNLQSLSEQMGLSTHQLSELINANFGFGFPRYIREHRVRAARKMLLDEPHASVLSIGLSTGFKSQSSFYTAFKETTGNSPGNFRRQNQSDSGNSVDL